MIALIYSHPHTDYENYYLKLKKDELDNTTYEDDERHYKAYKKSKYIRFFNFIILTSFTNVWEF